MDIVARPTMQEEQGARGRGVGEERYQVPRQNTTKL